MSQQTKSMTNRTTSHGVKIGKTTLAKKLIVFDLDNTLTQSKMAIGKDMAKLICALLSKKTVAVISGGSFLLLQKKFLSYLKCPKKLFNNLVLLPTSGSSFYKYKKGKWCLVYQHVLSQKDKKQIKAAFSKALIDINYKMPKKTYGSIIEDRKTQITFSALGQKAPLMKKREWNKRQDRRQEIKKALERYLPQFEIRIGGLTSIDITKKGIDKAYAVEQITKILKTSKNEIVFVGDAFFKGGGDYPVKRTGVETLETSGPEETKTFIRFLVLSLK